MEEKKQEIIEKLIDERLNTLEREKNRLEEQITKDTAKEQELPEAFLEQRKEKLAEVIKETKILESDEEEKTGSGD